MRITNNMIAYNFLDGVNKSLEKQNSLQEQLSDGIAIHRPSDDPLKTVRSMYYTTSGAMNDQYTTNVKDAQSWMDQTDSALNDLGSIGQRIKDLAVGADGSKPQDALAAIGTEINSLIDAAVNIGNTKIGDRYIFAGQQDNIQPFTRVQDSTTTPPTDMVTYSGDNNKILMRIQSGAQSVSQDSVNLTGNEVFGPMTSATINGKNTSVSSMFNSLIAIKNELLSGGGIIAQSNNKGGAAAVSGTYTPSVAGQDTYQDFVVKVGTVSAGVVTAAKYSTDGGQTYKDAVPVTAVPPVPGEFTLSNGAQIVINPSLATAANEINATGDTYSFHFPLGSRGTTNINWISNTALAQVDQINSSMLQQRTQLGARASTYQLQQTMLESNATTIAGDLSGSRDLDVSKAIVDFKTAQTVYQTALSVGAKIMPTSLADFLH
jgi:flagellar hook-associated protein 3 FlgL